MSYPLHTIGDLTVARTGPAKPILVNDAAPATMGAGAAVAVVVLGALVGALGVWLLERGK